MTLPSSGPLTSAQIVGEMGLGFPHTFPSTQSRELTGKATGSLVFPTDFHGRGLVMETDNRTDHATSHSTVNFGEDTPGRWVVVLATHGNTPTNPGHAPTCTIGGVAATRIVARSNGTGGGTAIGSAMFTAQVTGTSGTVAVSWSTLSTAIIVLRVVLYNLSAAHDAALISSSVVSVTPALVDIPANGLLIAFVSRGTADEITWSGVTEQGADTTTNGNKRRSRGWNYNMGVETDRAVSYSPVVMTADNGTNVGVIASFART